MAITLVCPNWKCRSKLSVPEETRGKRMRCSFCGCMFVVPATPPKRVPASSSKRHHG